MRISPLFAVAAFSALLVAGPVPRLLAQEEKQPAEARGDGAPEELATLLANLKALPPHLWEERARILEGRIARQREYAAALRNRAAALLAQAVERDALVAELLRELRRQEEVARALGAGAPPGEEASKRLYLPALPGRPLAALLPGSRGSRAGARPPAAGAKPTAATMKQAATAAAPARILSNFEDHVLPVIEQNCIGCHNPTGASGGLNLETGAGALQGAASGSVIVPGDAEGSRLYRLVSHQEQPTMPPDQGPIAKEQIEIIRRWIEDGALPDAAAARGAGEAMAAEARAAATKKPPALAPVAEGAVPMPPPLPAREDPEFVRAPVVKSLDQSPRAPLLAVAGLEEVALFNNETHECLGAFPFDFGQVEVVRFSRDGARLLAAGGVPGRRGAAVLYDVVTGKEHSRYKVGYDTILAAAISPGQSLVVFGGPDRRVRVFSTATTELLYEIDAHNEWILAVDVSPDGNYLASADRGGTIRVWQAKTGRDVHTLRGHAGAVHALRFRPDARTLASAGADRTLRIWELEDGKQLKSVRAHDGAVLAVNWSAGLEMATSGSDRRAKIWKSDGKALKTMSPLGDWGYSAAFSRDGKQLYVGTWSGIVQVFDCETGKEQPPFGGPAQ